MKNIKLTIAYDGTNYCGWQRQSRQLSIQEVLENKLSLICKEKVNIYGSGRTDARVHAHGQVANFHTQRSIPVETWQKALNSLLPKDIAILDAEEVDDKFHARYLAQEKHYRYRIVTNEIACPFERNYAWHMPYALNLTDIQKAADSLLGEHDFSSFQAAGSKVKSNIRNLKKATLSASEDTLQLDFSGNGFLRHMVRNIVGTLVDVGRGKLRSEELPKILESCNRAKAGPTAPAQGLYLMSVLY